MKLGLSIGYSGATMDLPVDRIMDMARTAVNVTGDAAVASAVAKWEGELDEEQFRAAPQI